MRETNMTRLSAALAIRRKDLCDVVFDAGPVVSMHRIGPRYVSLEFLRLVAIRNGARPTDDEAATLGMLLDYPPRYFQGEPYTDPDGPAFVCGSDTHIGTRCRFCGRGAAFACDYPMGDGGTCDRELCSACATETGPDEHRCPDHEGLTE